MQTHLFAPAAPALLAPPVARHDAAASAFVAAPDLGVALSDDDLEHVVGGLVRLRLDGVDGYPGSPA